MEAFTDPSPTIIGRGPSKPRLDKIWANTKWAQEQFAQARGATHGIILRSHYDFPLRDTQLVLLRGDRAGATLQTQLAPYIITDAGYLVRPRHALVLNQAAANGLGGLDTGSWSAGWYQVWYVFKTADGLDADLTAISDGLVAHAAFGPAVDANINNTSTSGGTASLRDATARTALAQGITPAGGGLVSWIDLYLQRVGNPSLDLGSVWVELCGDTAGAPNLADVKCRSPKIPIFRGEAGAYPIRFPMTTVTKFSVSASTQYHIVVQGDFPIDATNHAAWYASNTDAITGTNNIARVWNGSAWSAAAVTDFTARLGLQATPTSLTSPSGYDQHALIGWAYWTGSRFVRFIAHDRSLRYLEDIQKGPITSVVLTLDLAAEVPPIPVRLKAFSGHSVAGRRIGLGAVPEGIGITRETTNIPFHATVMITANASGTQPEQAFEPIWTEAQYAYGFNQTADGSPRIFLSGFDW